MAGHSKFANIKHRKAAQDKKRGKIFTKLIREITVAAKDGGDPDANPRLRLAIDKALGANMTRDTIERAIKRGSGGDDDTQYEEIRYEGYGPGGAAIMVDCMTDNRKRTVSDVRHAFTKAGGNLGTDGSVAFMFTRMGILSYPEQDSDDSLFEAAIEAGADDVESDENKTIIVTTSFENYLSVKEAMVETGFEPEHAEIIEKPNTDVQVSVDDVEKIMHLIETLEDLDDVQSVHTNAELPEAVLA